MGVGSLDSNYFEYDDDPSSCFNGNRRVGNMCVLLYVCACVHMHMQKLMQPSVNLIHLMSLYGDT